MIRALALLLATATAAEVAPMIHRIPLIVPGRIGRAAGYTAPANGGGEDFPNEPIGYTAIVGRHFDDKAEDDSDRGTGSYPYKVGGSEGFDGIEWQYSNLTIQTDAQAPHSPSNVMRFRYRAGAVADGTTLSPGLVQTLGFDTSTHGNLAYRKIYYKIVFKVSSNFQGHSTQTNKIHFMRSQEGPSSRFEPIVRLRGSDANPLRLNIDLQGSTTDPRNETGGLFANTAGASGTDVDDIQRGSWYEIEVVHEIGDLGSANGICKVWLAKGTGSPVLTHDYSDVEYEPDGGSRKWSHGHMNPTWGGQNDTVDEDMYLYVDELYYAGAA